MNRRTAVAIFIGSLALVGVGAFYVGNMLATSPQITPATTPSEILEEARKRVPAATLPPKPAGREVTELVPQEIQIDVPIVQMKQVSGPFGVKVSVPEQITVKRTITQPVPKTKLVDASPAEIAAWEASVKSVQEEYQSKLAAEVRTISAERQQANRNEIIESVQQMTKDTLIPFIAALTGLIGAMTVLFRGYAPNTESDEPTSSNSRARGRSKRIK